MLLGFYNYTVLLTYLGMLISFAGIILTMQGSPYAALICLLLSGICDMFDGRVAATKVRTRQEKCFGIQIDSLSDLICFGVLPALIVCQLAGANFFSCVLGGLYLLCALIRLAWFNVDEAERQSGSSNAREFYQGLPVTSSALIFPATLGLARLFNWPLPLFALSAMLLTALAFLLPFKLQKPRLPMQIAMLVCGLAEFLMLVVKL